MKLIRKIRFITLLVHFAFCIITFTSLENKAQIKTAMQEKMNIKERIFMDSELLKHKKSRAESTNSLKTENTNENNTENTEEQIKSKNRDASSKVLFEGWIKYFKFPENSNEKNPKTFRKNGEFYEQLKLYPGIQYEKKNGKGVYEYIRNDDFFYLSVFKNLVSIFSSKKNNRRNLIDTFTITEIRPVYEDDEYFEKGGLLKFGNFNEGYCFKIFTRGVRNMTWVFCLEDVDEMRDLISILRKLKLDQQRQDGIAMLLPKKNTQKQNSITITDIYNKPLGNGLSSMEEDCNKNKTMTKTDGYWINVSQWTPCSVQCGGGIAGLQRICIPPKNGGNPCRGSPILTKQCNTQPCPEKESCNSTNIKKPIIKIIKFSNLPQRYLKCKIKESDLMLYQNLTDLSASQNIKSLLDNVNLEGLLEISVPVRVIMNNETVSIYTGDNINTLFISFKLKNVKFLRHDKKSECFLFKETELKKVTLCQFSQGNAYKEVEQWDYDFHLFKNQCAEVPDKYVDITKELQYKLQYKIRQAEKDIKIEEQEQRKIRRQQDEKKNLQKIVKKTNNIAMEALKKEISLEQLIQQEEEERIKREEEDIKKNIEEEKKKKDCVMKAIKERELENQYNIQAKEIELTINNIKQETAQQVMQRRTNLKKIIEKLRQKHDLRKNKLKEELQNVKISIANEIGKHYKKGDIKKCQNSVVDPKFRDDYCTESFKEDYSNMNYCKTSYEFCNFCCENEFSELFPDERIRCVREVCNAQKSKKMLEDTLDCVPS